MATQQGSSVEGSWLDVANVVLGIWLIVAPLVGVGASTGLAAGNSYVAGVVVVILAVAASRRPYLWEEWLNLLVGVWLILAPFALRFTAQTGPTWNQIIVGLLIVVDAGWAATRMQHAPHGHA
ncbi:MAG: SPW repeat protein [Gammaproteobacteria bacterium]|nr:SPW repeat protein [Gammaproteobacteria bacterium]